MMSKSGIGEHCHDFAAVLTNLPGEVSSVIRRREIMSRVDGTSTGTSYQLQAYQHSVTPAQQGKSKKELIEQREFERRKLEQLLRPIGRRKVSLQHLRQTRKTY